MHAQTPGAPEETRPGQGSHPQKIPLLPGLPRPGCPSDSRDCGLFVCSSRKHLGWSLMRASLAPRRAVLEGTICHQPRSAETPNVVRQVLCE